jgi:hypothetical protein
MSAKENLQSTKMRHPQTPSEHIGKWQKDVERVIVEVGKCAPQTFEILVSPKRTLRQEASLAV